MTLHEFTQLPSAREAVNLVERRLIAALNATGTARHWRTLLEFRIAVYVDGLWHAYGNYYERNEVDELKQAFGMIGARELMDRIDSGLGETNELEERLKSEISNEVLFTFVQAHWPEFQSVLTE